MSDVLTSSAVWRVEKSVDITGHTRHRHNPSPISVGFNAPRHVQDPDVRPAGGSVPAPAFRSNTCIKMGWRIRRRPHTATP